MNNTRSQRRPFTVWTQLQDGLAECSVRDCFQLGGADSGTQENLAERSDLPVLVALHERAPALALLLVPDTFGPPLRVNSVLQQPGAHLLEFGSQIDFDGRTYWVSVDRAAERTVYDPARHGEDVFGHLTKARLNPGDEIVVCPGQAEQPCGLISLSVAWDAAVESSDTFRCSNCGFDPRAVQWRPVPLNETRDRVHELLEKAEAGVSQFATLATNAAGARKESPR